MTMLSKLQIDVSPVGFSSTGASLIAPTVDWRCMQSHDHFVQFYENDDSLVQSISGFIGAGIGREECCLVIATASHVHDLERDLERSGIDLECARLNGTYIVLDAAEALDTFMVCGVPDPVLFAGSIGQVVSRAAATGRPIRAFGEMVALLWTAGNGSAAILLEELWNQLATRHTFALFCAYSMAGFGAGEHADAFQHLCSAHTRVIPAESYSESSEVNDRLRIISGLQQKAAALEAEVAQRIETQRVLAARERELSDFFENAMEGLHRVGPDGKILWANRAELEMLGYSSDEYIGHHISEFHVDQLAIADMLERLLNGESLRDQPARLRCKDGSIRHVIIHSNALFENDEFVHTRCFTRDITERVRMEAALREHVEEIETLNARLRRSITETHHRVKNNLQLMSALIEMQKETERDSVPMSELVRVGHNIQALAVIHDLLTRQAKEVGDATVISVKAVLDQLLTILQQTLTGRLILSTIEEAQLPGKHVTALALIANELISNAVKHGKGDISLNLYRDKGLVILEALDDGPGFGTDFDPGTSAHTGLELIENIARFDLRGHTCYENRASGGARVAVMAPEAMTL